MRFSNINNEEHLDTLKERFIAQRANLSDTLGDCLFTALEDFLKNTERYKEKCLEQGFSINYPIISFDYGVSKSDLEESLDRLYEIESLEDIVYSDEEGNHHYDFSFPLKGQRVYGYGDNEIGSLALYCTFVE